MSMIAQVGLLIASYLILNLGIFEVAGAVMESPYDKWRVALGAYYIFVAVVWVAIVMTSF